MIEIPNLGTMLSLPSDKKNFSICLVSTIIKYIQMVPSFDYHKKTAQNKGTKDNDPRKSRVSIIIIK